MSYLSDILGDAYHDGMSEEEISSELEKLNGSQSNEITKLKASLSKANSEAASYKKQLRDKQTEDEKAKSEREEEMDKVKGELEALKRSNLLTETKAKYIALGFDEKLASETAEAMVEGDYEKVFANQAIFTESLKKKLTAEQQRNVGRPSGTNNNDSPTDYSEKISKARADGDIAAEAYYTRLAAEAEAKANQT